MKKRPACIECKFHHFHEYEEGGGQYICKNEMCRHPVYGCDMPCDSSRAINLIYGTTCGPDGEFFEAKV